MNTTPDDLLDRYAQAVAHDPSRPSANVRAAVLNHADTVARARLEDTSMPTASTHRPPVASNQPRWALTRLASVAALAATGVLVLFMEKGTSTKNNEATQHAEMSAPPAAQSTQRATLGTAQSNGRAAAPAAAVAKQDSAGAVHSPLSDSAQATRGLAPSANLSLLQAVRSGDVLGLSAQLQAGVAVDTRDDAGQTALMIAVETGRIAVVQKLLNAGADTRLVDRQGKTALDQARQRNAVPILTLLQLHPN